MTIIHNATSYHKKWLKIGQKKEIDRLIVTGNTSPLHGHLDISGSKNATLPILAACLLTHDVIKLNNVPLLSDVSNMLQLLLHLGSQLNETQSDNDHSISLTTPLSNSIHAPYNLVRKMRTSILVLGPLLTRFGKACVSLPGGCAIGARPIDLHLDGLRCMGADIALRQNYVIATCPKGRLQGTEITLRFPSVGATQNLMMAACLAEGETCLQGTAKDPEIIEFSEFLNTIGAEINGAGSDEIRIKGQIQLHGGEYSIQADRIQAASYALLVAASHGEADIGGMQLESLGEAIELMERMGLRFIQRQGYTRVSANDIHAVDVITAPFPGYPTDIQAQTMVLLMQADGQSTITERIFENRFMHVPELQSMGADIRLDGDCATINATPIQQRVPIIGTEVIATDLRASFCLIMLGLLANGQTTIKRLYHLDRGYEDIALNLRRLGAKVERL